MLCGGDSGYGVLCRWFVSGEAALVVGVVSSVPASVVSGSLGVLDLAACVAG